EDRVHRKIESKARPVFFMALLVSACRKSPLEMEQRILSFRSKLGGSMTRSLVQRLFKSAFVLALALLGLCAPQVWAQITTQGTVAVRVLDQSGAAVADAKLTLVDLASNRSQTVSAGSSGTYTFVALTVGTYKLTVEKGGFQQQVIES